jgi:hypothetical protein
MQVGGITIASIPVQVGAAVIVVDLGGFFRSAFGRHTFGAVIGAVHLRLDIERVRVRFTVAVVTDALLAIRETAAVVAAHDEK